MILTRFMINQRRQGARKLLGSPQAMHAAVLSGFSPGVDPGRVLWRVDGMGTPQIALWIVAHAAPDLAHVEEQAGWPSQPTTRSIDYTPLLDGLERGQNWAFRLTANPTHRATIGGRKKVLAHVTAQQQIEWLAERASRIGVMLDEAGDPSFTVVGREVKKFRRDNAVVTLATATYQGILKVSDPELLRTAMTQGVGRGKGYGCGLLTLSRP